MGVRSNGGPTVMEKNRTTNSVGEVAAARPSSTGRASALKKWFFSPGVALRELVMNAGLESFKEILEQDREDLCGSKNPPHPERIADPHGHDDGRVGLRGRKVVLGQPRARENS